MSVDEFRKEVLTGVESFEKKDRSFDCVACASRFMPAPDQWIFYELCDSCFSGFNHQKMNGRMWMFGPQTTPEPVEGVDYFEGVDAWVRSRSAKA
jgi:hypothetical protein